MLDTPVPNSTSLGVLRCASSATEKNPLNLIEVILAHGKQPEPAHGIAAGVIQCLPTCDCT